MTISTLIAAAKAIAKVIEYKSPGTCTTILRDLDKTSMHPAVIKQRVDSLKHLWEKYKDTVTPSETSELSSSVGFDVSDPSTWDSFFDFSDIASTTVDVVDAVSDATDVASTATDIADTTESASGLIDTILDLFS